MKRTDRGTPILATLGVVLAFVVACTQATTPVAPTSVTSTSGKEGEQPVAAATPITIGASPIVIGPSPIGSIGPSPLSGLGPSPLPGGGGTGASPLPSGPGGPTVSSPTPTPGPSGTPGPGPTPTPAATPLAVVGLTVASGQVYQVIGAGVDVGDRVYTDKTYTYTAIPRGLIRQIYIRTAADDNDETADPFIVFECTAACAVYLGVRSAVPVTAMQWINRADGWLTTSFVPEALTARTPTATIGYRFYKKGFGPRTQVKLGPQNNTAGEMYVIFVLGG